MKYIIVFYFLITIGWAEDKYSNALINEDSPYLQQHAHNPVNWYPWGKEALQKAKKENKLIFLSIGYSTCHWCHVMEEESFADEDVAKLLNDGYVAIKVDKEELPQLDKKYQKLYLSVHGERGGWPLTVFMSPDAKPFHITTYIPAEEGYGSKGMMNILPCFVRQYHTKPEALQQLAEEYKRLEIQGDKKLGLKQQSVQKTIEKVIAEVREMFDTENGGFASRPKFPEASKIELLLSIYRLNGNKEAFYMAERTLKKMAQGGIYDQIGGGFFRYTTDRQWQIPHFEKMLYTNAELIPVYVTLYELTKKPLYKKIVDETISQMEQHFMKEGVYLSASDADSDKEEGGYFIYEYITVKSELLQKGMKLEDVEEALAYLGIEEDGNIDGDFSHAHITSAKVPKKLQEVKAYLKSVRAKRTFPFVDEKIITAWNAMMIKALFCAAKIENRYLPLAKKRLEALLMLMKKNRGLYHQTLLGKPPRQEGLLEDYAFLTDAMIEAYLRTYDKSYLHTLKILGDEAIGRFYKEGVWYLSDDTIKVRADFDDRYYTSALSVMLESLVRLSSLTEELEYNEIVKETMKKSGVILETNPSTAPKLMHTFLRLKEGDVIIKSKVEKLRKSQKVIEAMQYPFVLSKAEESEKYLACKVNSCFAYDRNITALIDKIEKAGK